MIVDDEPFVREGLKKIIDWNSEGFEVVHEAKNAYEAIQVLEEENIDLIFLDILMPRMNGIELSKFIRERISKTIDIVFLTGYLTLEFVNEAINVSAIQYLQKPIQPNLLIDILRNVRKKLGEKLEAEKRRKNQFADLREHYLTELLYGVKRDEYINYLKSIYRQDTKFYYVHFIFYPEKKDSEQVKRLSQIVAETTMDYQRANSNLNYVLICHLPSHNEQAVGVMITDTMLRKIRSSIYELVERLLRDLTKVRGLKCIAKIGKCVTDISLLGESYQDAINSVSYSCKSKEIPLELRLNSYLQAHYMENITLKSLSEQFFVNSAYLGQFFKKHNGMYLKEYLNTIRVNKSLDLLLYSTMKIYQISAAVGFQSADSYIVAFSKVMKVTPQKYRQENSKILNSENDT